MAFIIKRIQNEVHSLIDEDLAENRLTEEQAQSAKGGANAALGLLYLELPRPTNYESDCDEEWQIAHWESDGFDVAILERNEYGDSDKDLAVNILDSMYSGNDEQLEAVALTILAAVQLKKLKEKEKGNE